MTTKEIKYWSAIPFVVTGALVGLLILLYLRVEYYMGALMAYVLIQQVSNTRQQGTGGRGLSILTVDLFSDYI